MNIRIAFTKSGKCIGCMSILLISGLLVLAAGAGHADTDLASGPGPSCYQSVKLERPPESMPTREIVIALDQTTKLPARLIETLHKTVETLVIPGSRISVVTFSAYSSQHHLHNARTLEIELPPPPARKRKIPIVKMRTLEDCLELQAIASKITLNRLIASSMQGVADKITRSEITNAMRILGPRFVESRGTKILLMVSDGLEHAPGVTSFYQKQQLRRIDAAKEVAAMKSQQRLANLVAVRVYFFGGAIGPDEGIYRDEDAVTAVKNFWMLYVAASGGTLVEFGTPELQSQWIR